MGTLHFLIGQCKTKAMCVGKRRWRTLETKGKDLASIHAALVHDLVDFGPNSMDWAPEEVKELAERICAELVPPLRVLSEDDPPDGYSDYLMIESPWGYDEDIGSRLSDHMFGYSQPVQDWWDDK